MNLLRNLEEASLDSLDLKWNKLGLSERLLAAIKKEFKFQRMTPVQAATIPLMLTNKDVIVEAKTGSGKTLAFLIPIVESLIRLDLESPIGSHDLLSIILSPTRELATQTHQELRKLLRNDLLTNNRRLVHHLIVGGGSVSADIDKYNKYGANIIVATPGRLSAILQMSDNPMSACVRKKLAYLIFDEADQLLSFGFEKDLSSILAYLPKQRRTSLFSATQTSEVEDLIKSGLRNPIRVDVNKLDDSCKLKNSSKQRVRVEDDEGLSRMLPMPDKLINYYHVCDSYAHKLAFLTELIRTDKHKKVLVFLSTCSQIDYFSWCIQEELKDKKMKILKLHRRLKNKRKSVLREFKSSKSCLLFVTDILSRGIDVPDIACVIHLDLPSSPECYVHRSGRSGHQINLSGMSLLLLERHETDYVEMCRRRQIDLAEMTLKSSEEVLEERSKGLIRRLSRRASKEEAFQTLGIQAFVSYIRFYSSKLCLRLLLFPRLPVAQLALSFGLTRLPKMPELRTRHKSIEAELGSKSAQL